MQLSLIICTRNRATVLARALTSISAMALPAGLSWELVVVDNGGADETPQVAHRFADRLPVRVVSEPTAGLSNARNRGVAEARGDYIVWTDDDVEVAPDWLAAYVDAFARYDDCVLFAGRITPELEGPTPPWFAANHGLLATLQGERAFGPDPLPLDLLTHRLPFGANYAVRTDVQRRHPYDPGLGIGPDRRRSGEETRVSRDILREGGKGMWIPQAEVRHHVEAVRQSEAHVEGYYRALGETWAYLCDSGGENFFGDPPAGPRNRAGVPLEVDRRFAQHDLKYRLLRIVGPSRKWLWHLMQRGFYAGARDYWRSKAD